MKTFDEALATTVYKNGDGDGKLRCEETLDRYRQLTDEVCENELIQHMAGALAEAVSEGVMSPERALVNMFANGVRCGIEMEKAE